MKINIVALIDCLRTIKQAEALWGMGHELHLFVGSEHQSYLHAIHNWAMFTGISPFVNEAQLEYLLSRHQDADFTYVHLPTNELVLVAKRAANGKHPVVLDAHDWDSILIEGFPEQAGTAAPFEDESVKAADLIVLPSYSYQEYCKRKWGRDSIVLFPGVPNRMFPHYDFNRLDAIVYAGQINSPSFSFREVTAAMDIFDRKGIPTFLYPTGPEGSFDRYRKLHVNIEMSVSNQVMIHELTKFTWSYVGSPIPCVAMDTCMPNKLMDAVAAGVPVIVHNAKEAGEWAEKNGYGIYIKGNEDLQNADLSAEAAEPFRQNLRRKLEDGTQERERWQMENLLQPVLAGLKSLGVNTEPTIQVKHPLPSLASYPAEMKEYDAQYRFTYEFGHYLPLGQRVVEEIQKRVPAGGQVVDAACGIGWLADMLHRSGYGVNGFDGCRSAVECARRLTPTVVFHCADIYNVGYKVKPDAVVLVEVLEHLKDDETPIKNIPAGALVLLSVPFEDEVPFHLHVQTYSVESARAKFGKYLDVEICERALPVPPKGWQGEYPYILVVGRRRA